MLRDNLIMLRNINGFSQEEIASRIGISRQAYAKWESGATIPDIEKCASLARIYNVSIDSLIKTETHEGIGRMPPGPKGKNIWGTVTLGDRGQIVIPKPVRDKFNLAGGSRLVLLSDDSEGLALIPVEWFEERMKTMLAFASIKNEDSAE